MPAINYIRAEMAAQNIASLCAMMRVYTIAGDTASAIYTRQRLTQHLAQTAAALGYVLAPMMPDQQHVKDNDE